MAPSFAPAGRSGYGIFPTDRWNETMSNDYESIHTRSHTFAHVHTHMREKGSSELRRLRLAAENSRAAVVAWREALVESLGARICGEGDGPTQAEIDKLAQLEEAEARAQQDYAVCLLAISTSSSNLSSASNAAKRSRSMS